MIPVKLPSGKEVMLLSSPADSVTDGDLTNSTYTDVSFRLEFQDLIDVATEIGTMLRLAIEKILPTKAAVELSIGVDAKTGKITAFFVEGGADGSIKIALEWARPGVAPS
jgi:Trypsin-co-occurring domain 1